MNEGEIRITKLKRDRRVRVTQTDEDGNILMEHSFPIADDMAHIRYEVTDEYTPDVHTEVVYAKLTHWAMRP